MKRIFYVVLSVLLFASFLLTACGTPATEVPSEPVAPEATEAPAPTEVPAPTFRGTATITFVQEPDNLNPMYTSMSFSGYLRPFYLKPSWDFDENGQPVPVLVQEIPSAENGGLSADGKTVTLKLRDDVVWSDGEPLTADGYAFTFDMSMSEKNTPLGRYPYDTWLYGLTVRPSLLRLHLGMFAVHFMITATFLAVPAVLVEDLGLPSPGHWKVYLAVFVASVAGTVPLVLATERTRRGPALLVFAILLAAASQAMLGEAHGHFWLVMAALTLFFAVSTTWRRGCRPC